MSPERRLVPPRVRQGMARNPRPRELFVPDEVYFILIRLTVPAQFWGQRAFYAGGGCDAEIIVVCPIPPVSPEMVS